MKRRPCPTCPWRSSTPRGGFPGGIIDADRVVRMAAGEPMVAMQCHATPDANARACVGFAVRVGFTSVGLRLAAAMGVHDQGAIEEDPDDPLLTLEQLLEKHGGVPEDRGAIGWLTS